MKDVKNENAKNRKILRSRTPEDLHPVIIDLSLFCEKRLHDNFRIKVNYLVKCQ